jgi:four helix bundle protein
MATTFKDLRVWQQAMKLAVQVYHATQRFPRSELYGLTSQIRRAVVSVPSNIAEGKGHHSDRAFVNFLFHARGSLLELQTQLMLAAELGYMEDNELNPLLQSANELARSLNGLINSLRSVHVPTSSYDDAA